MSDALKRIEERHKDEVFSDGFVACAECGDKPPCDVVRLARALEKIQLQCSGHADEFSRTVYQVAERTLEKVGG